MKTGTSRGMAGTVPPMLPRRGRTPSGTGEPDSDDLERSAMKPRTGHIRGPRSPRMPYGRAPKVSR
jgi:hypothetical protein